MRAKRFLLVLPLFFICTLILFPVAFFEGQPAAQTLVGAGIFIDPGHGGFDCGSTREGVLEKEINMKIASALFEDVLNKGAIAFLTRAGDYDLSRPDSENHKREDLQNRADKINASGASLLVSLHLNALDDSSVRGPMVYYRAADPVSKKLAAAVQDELNRCTGLEKIIHPERYYLFRKTEIPAILVECGFLSNPEDRADLLSIDYREELASSISAGIAAFMDVASAELA